jgi:AcrR family transcriptional regulator
MGVVSVDGVRRTEILETAAKLFASSGLRTSVQQIADACGILPGSLYHHFESKEAIVVELIERYRADLDDIAKRALDDLQGPEPDSAKIMALSTAVTTSYSNSPCTTSTTSRTSPEENSPSSSVLNRPGVA